MNIFKINNGWFDSLYFYETRLSWYKRILGALIDKWLASQFLKELASKKINLDEK
jgi:hypothetical protein